MQSVLHPLRTSLPQQVRWSFEAEPRPGGVIKASTWNMVWSGITFVKAMAIHAAGSLCRPQFRNQDAHRSKQSCSMANHLNRQCGNRSGNHFVFRVHGSSVGIAGKAEPRNTRITRKKNRAASEPATLVPSVFRVTRIPWLSSFQTSHLAFVAGVRCAA